MVDLARLRRAFARMADVTEDEAREIAEDLQRRIAAVEARYQRALIEAEGAITRAGATGPIIAPPLTDVERRVLDASIDAFEEECRKMLQRRRSNAAKEEEP